MFIPVRLKLKDGREFFRLVPEGLIKDFKKNMSAHTVEVLGEAMKLEDAYSAVKKFMSKPKSKPKSKT